MGKPLILLGAGATAAVTNGNLPTGENFFCNNKQWTNRPGSYPHLELAYRKVQDLKCSGSDPISLTDAWLFIDTLFKYHSAINSNNAYNYKLLQLRYRDDGTSIPHYLTPQYLNQHYARVCSGMRPLFSRLYKKIYETFPRTDPIYYFLILAGWELKHLLYRTYNPQEETNDLYRSLLKKLKMECIPVINFNFDIYFERACRQESWDLKLETEANEKSTELPAQKTILLCKPHGGWNIRHTDNEICPFPILSDSIEDCSFDRFEDREVLPAMIPYFSMPDEISNEHLSQFPGVGEYFVKQQKVMKKMLKEAERIVSIGYSFSKDDLHVTELIKEMIQGESGQQIHRRMLCILKDDKKIMSLKTKKRIMELWQSTNDHGGKGRFQYHEKGFDKQSITKIAKFFESN